MISGFEKKSFQTDEEYKKYILPVVITAFILRFAWAVIYFRQEKKVILLSSSVILFFILFHVLYVAPERYHFFIIPFLVMLAGIGIEKKCNYLGKPGKTL